MNFAHGLGLGIFGTTFTLVALLIAYIIYERHRKNIERIEADKKKKTPYDFK
jgi:glycerol-3-phosphate acyltransferase PlsY